MKNFIFEAELFRASSKNRLRPLGRLTARLRRGRGLGRRTPTRFWGEVRADTALEFAMIGSAFFLLLFGVFVVSIDQFWQLTLDEAVRTAARQVQIGKATSGPTFVTAVCNVFGLAAPNCNSTTIQYDVQTTPYFANAGFGASTFGTSGLATSTGFPSSLTGSSCSTTPNPEFLLVQVAYKLPFTIPLISSAVATENGTSYILSTVATDMEPGVGITNCS